MKRVTGHALVAEGRGFARLYGGEDPYGPSGYGGRLSGPYGRCSCGKESPALTTDAARQRWHKEHKAAVIAERGEAS